MMDHLRASNIKVLNFILYRRQCPETAAKTLAENLGLLEAQQHFAVLITSEASWLNWLTLLQRMRSLYSEPVIWFWGHVWPLFLGISTAASGKFSIRTNR